MTPAELLALAEAATAGPGDTPPHSWTGARAGEKMIASARLIALAPDLAWLVAEWARELEIMRTAEQATGTSSTPPEALVFQPVFGQLAAEKAAELLAKLSELEVRA